jgi:hypothetical protein
MQVGMVLAYKDRERAIEKSNLVSRILRAVQYDFNAAKTL